MPNNTISFVVAEAERQLSAEQLQQLVYKEPKCLWISQLDTEVKLPLKLSSGGDFVYTVRKCDEVKRGEILVNDLQRRQLRAVGGQKIDFVVFDEADEEKEFGKAPLHYFCAEIRSKYFNPEEKHKYDAEDIVRHLNRQLFNHYVSENEVFATSFDGKEFIVRVAEVGPDESEEEKDTEEGEGEGEEEKKKQHLSTLHFFRGRVDVQTSIFLSIAFHPIRRILHKDEEHALKDEELKKADLKAGEEYCDNLTLYNVKKKEEKKKKNMVKILTSDDEFFLVKKNILRPCIELTSILRGKTKTKLEEEKEEKKQMAAEGKATLEQNKSGIREEADEGETKVIWVDIGCLIFDRILQYLELEYKGKESEFSFDINVTEVLLRAATLLGVNGLVNSCREKIGDFQSRVREIPLEELYSQIDSGKCWVVIDAMVFDLTKWLPQHPGGKTIIPRQALKNNATYWFEIYHATRESFLYLKQFYIGL